MNLCFFYVTKASKKLVMNKNPSNWWHELTVLFVYLVVIHKYLVHDLSLHVISILLPYSGITWSKKKEILLPVGFIKWSNKLKRFVGNLATNCLSVFDHLVKFALKGWNYNSEDITQSKMAPEERSCTIL